MYVRDMMPSMLGIFVARGKREVQSHRTPEPPPMPPMPSPTDVRQKVEGGIDVAAGAAQGRRRAASALAKDVAGQRRRPRATSPAPRSQGSCSGATTTGHGYRERHRERTRDPDRRARPRSSRRCSAPAPTAGRGQRRARQTDAPDVDALPIPDYDELSASQVVERLEGLDHDSLEAIRRYEAGHRGAQHDPRQDRAAQLTWRPAGPPATDDIPRIVELAHGLMRAELSVMKGGALWLRARGAGPSRSMRRTARCIDAGRRASSSSAPSTTSCSATRRGSRRDAALGRAASA